MEFMRAGGSYAVVFGKNFKHLQPLLLGQELKSAYAPSKIVSHDGQGLTAVEKIFNKNALGVPAKGNNSSRRIRCSCAS
jgi:aconitate hydratase 2/2-methylisocitrate dehydratase